MDKGKPFMLRNIPKADFKMVPEHFNTPVKKVFKKGREEKSQLSPKEKTCLKTSFLSGNVVESLLKISHG
jgi:hypothetical protein